MLKDKYKYLVLGIVSLLYNLVYFHRVSTSVIADDLIKDIHLNATELGAMSSTYFIFYAIVQPFVGYFSDKYGPKKVLLVFVSISLVACAGFAFINDFNSAVIVRSLMGIGLGGISIPSIKLLAEWFESKEFAKANSILASVGLTGALMATAPLAYLSMSFGWRNVFFIFAFIELVFFVLACIYVKDKKSEPAGKLEKSETTQPETSIKLILTNKNFWLITLIFFATFGAYLSFQGLWATKCISALMNISSDQANNYMTFIPIGLIIGAISAGFLSDNIFHSRKIPLRSGMVGILFCWIIITFISSSLPHYLMYPLYLFLGISAGIVLPLLFVVLKDICPPELFGTALGLFNPAYFLGCFVYQNITSVILDFYKENNAYTAHSFTIMMIFCIITIAVTTAMSFFIDETFDMTN